MMEFKLHDDDDNDKQLQQQEDTRTPQILYGQAAHDQNASVIVAAAEQSTNDVDDCNITLKLTITSACWKTDAAVEFDNASGMAVITEDALLFQCSQNSDYSVAMDAECILLHAQAEDDCVLYLQLAEEANNNNIAPGDEEVMELTLTLESANDCQQIFDALSQLVSLHPVHDNDDNDDADNSAAGMMMMMMGNGHEENYGDDMVVAERQLREQTAGETTEDEERNAMLDRLDTMLVVPPHLEQPNEQGADDDDGEGQFDDAEDDVDELL
mmetsp:Transcript_21967/g.36351  ORF Transcript_21967/g.36351 Transcript_21967/m.36351 type:complete len:270 (-) Transcript_21967:57-866(-)